MDLTPASQGKRHTLQILSQLLTCQCMMLWGRVKDTYIFLGDAYPMPIRCLSDGYPMPIRRLSDAYLTSIRWPIWRLSDGHLIFLIHIYYLSDGYPMPIWRLSGGIWWLPNVYWTPSTTYEMGIQWLSNGISFLLPEEANRWSCLQIPGGTKSLLLSFCFILVLPCPTI